MNLLFLYNNISFYIELKMKIIQQNEFRIFLNILKNQQLRYAFLSFTRKIGFSYNFFKIKGLKATNKKI